jgi:hypothetical protein
MSAGGVLGNGISYAGNGVLAALSNISVTALSTAVNALESAIGPWRPPQWANPAITSILIPGTPGTQYQGSSGFSGASGSLGALFLPNAGGIPTISVYEDAQSDAITQGSPSQVLIFDGVLRLEHEQSAVPTEFPVQTGANLSDHIYIKPARLVMEIFMSDVMQSYTPGQFSSSFSRSVSAYMQLKNLLINRTIVTVNTKLDTYPNMAVVSIHAPDNFETIYSLKATVTFQQLFTAQVSSQNSSSRTQTTDANQLGSVPTTGVPDLVTTDYQPPDLLPSQPYVPYAGDYSSNFVTDVDGS